MKIPEAKAAAEDWDKLEILPVWDIKTAKPKAEVVRQEKRDGRICSFCINHGSFAERHAERAKHLQNYKRRIELLGRQRQRRQRIESSTSGEQRISSSELSGYNSQIYWYNRRSQRRGVGIHASKYACRKLRDC